MRPSPLHSFAVGIFILWFSSGSGLVSVPKIKHFLQEIVALTKSGGESSDFI